MNTDLGVGEDTPVNQGSAVHGKDAIPWSGNHRTKARGHQGTLQQALDQRGGWDQIDALLEGRPDRGMGRFSLIYQVMGVQTQHKTSGEEGELFRTDKAQCVSWSLGDRAILRLSVQTLSWPHH